MIRRLQLCILASAISSRATGEGYRFLPIEPELLKQDLRGYVTGKEEIYPAEVALDTTFTEILKNPALILEPFVANTWRHQNDVLGKNITNAFRSLRSRAQEDLVGSYKHVAAEFGSDGVEFVNRLWSQGGPIEEFIETVIEQDMYKAHVERLRGKGLALAEKVPSWRCYVNYNLLELHNRLFRENNYGPKSNPGWYDTKQIVYASKVDLYVSDDRRQREMAETVATLSGLSTRIVTYDSFFAEL